MMISYGEIQRNKSTVDQKLYNEIPISETVNTIFENSDDVVFGVDATGKVSYWNKHCEDLFGFNHSLKSETKHCSDLLCGDDKKCGENCCDQCAIKANMESELQINDFTLNIKTHDGELVQMNIGTCYFYQSDKNKASTYFSLRKVNK